MTKSRNPISNLPPQDPNADTLLVVIETPKGSRNKYRFNESLGVFELGAVLPAGMSFPYDFGFVPRTRAEDGDPLDVLLLLDVPVFPGCVVESRLIGVIEAEQSEDGKMIRNDRLVTVAVADRDYAQLQVFKRRECPPARGSGTLFPVL